MFRSTGSLNAHKVYIVPKNRLTSDRSARTGNVKSSSTSSASSSSPFEQSFRVQVQVQVVWLFFRSWQTSFSRRRRVRHRLLLLLFSGKFGFFSCKEKQEPLLQQTKESTSLPAWYTIHERKKISEANARCRWVLKVQRSDFLVRFFFLFFSLSVLVRQVRLPRNQLFVTRLTGRTQLADLLHTVCNEKALDPRHYELRHPGMQQKRVCVSVCVYHIDR